MAYQITVEGKYGSRNGSYILNVNEKGQPLDIIRESIDIKDQNRAADLYEFRIRDLNLDEEYVNGHDEDCHIVFEEPWLFFNCTKEQMMNLILEYLKDGNWDFPQIYDNKLVNLPLTEMVTLCYPLHVPQKPIIERQRTFKLLRAIVPYVLADLFGLNRKDIEVFPINKRFNPDHWSWEMHQARRMAKEEGTTLKDLFS